MMNSKKIRVRFAPSPTGELHIGGARTALYNYLFSRIEKNGKCILRIEDTDSKRSHRKYEESFIKSFEWLGITFDESPQNPGEYGPYRQSERLEIYQNLIDRLIEQGKAYHCFLTEKELEVLSSRAKKEKRAPHYYHDQYKNLSKDEVILKINEGNSYVVRFKNPQRTVTFYDHVRGNLTFPPDMVGDFVIQRTNKKPVYNFCCAVDDILMKISHVIRGNEHLSNTLKQILIAESLQYDSPSFIHVSLLLGEDHQKLSKRDGITSIQEYQKNHFQPLALNNYLCLLGWSHPDEKEIFDVHHLGKLFTLNRFIKSPALYNIEKLHFFNRSYLRSKTLINFISDVEEYFILSNTPSYLQQSQEWKKTFCSLYQEKISTLKDLDQYLKDCFEIGSREMNDEVEKILMLKSTTQLKDFLELSLHDLKEQKVEYIEEKIVLNWIDHLKKTYQIKGRPLFMGLRVLLTGKSHGGDLKKLISLSPCQTLFKRIKNHSS